MDSRPDPDQLLRRVQAEEEKSRRGKLKLFFGANPGVGKTYAMLESAQQRRKEGVDVVAGIVETHGRAETAALLEGIAILPRRQLEYKGVKLTEFDLDAALARKPGLVLVDELAHTNAPGSRHAKRWQDVEELLNAGVSVYTTLNVQHWESLNDVVAQVTGVAVRETVPDTFLEQADEVELVDLPPEDLLRRLKDGKVYMGELAERAADNFFKPGNLIALRELALRHTAERVDVQMRAYKEEQAIQAVWPVHERLLVGITPSPLSPRLVRAAARMAARLQADWMAAYVETPKSLDMPPEDRNRLLQTFKMAEQLGAETATLNGEDVTQELIQYARSHNVTKIILGKPARPLWREWLTGSIVNRVARQCGDIDLYVISGMPGTFAARRPVAAKPEQVPWRGISWAVGTVAACTLVDWPLSHWLDRTNLVMLYLIGVMLVAYRFSRLPAMVAAVLAVVAFDFFYVPPYFSISVSDKQYLLTFVAMFTMGLVVSALTGRLRQQADVLRQRVYRTRMLYRLSQELSETPDPKALPPLAWKHLSDFYKLPVLIFVRDDKSGLRVAAGDSAAFKLTVEGMGAAEYVFFHREPAGMGTDTLSGVGALYLPLRGLRGPVGVLAIHPDDSSFFKDPDQFQLLETLAAVIGGALESTEMSAEAGRTEAQIETERLRNMILSSFSLDLRDPLHRLVKHIDQLLDPVHPPTPAVRDNLLKQIRQAADQLNKLVADIPGVLASELGAAPTLRKVK